MFVEEIFINLQKLTYQRCHIWHGWEKAWRSSLIFEIICGIPLSTYFNIHDFLINIQNIFLVLAFLKYDLPFLCFWYYHRCEKVYSDFNLLYKIIISKAKDDLQVVSLYTVDCCIGHPVLLTSINVKLK